MRIVQYAKPTDYPADLCRQVFILQMNWSNKEINFFTFTKKEGINDFTVAVFKVRPRQKEVQP